jgi:DNA-binding response OmpR family regulator
MSVLVVEGYADLRAAIVETLERREVSCDSATSAEDAIGKLRSHHYEAILLAPRLPIRSDPVMRFLHDAQPDELAKVILMTDPAMDEDSGSDDCRVLAKPFNNEELMAKLSDQE